MIKVTKHGNHAMYFATCMSCGCEMECSNTDVLLDKSTSAARMYVICPECGNRAYITGGQCPGNGITAVSGFCEVGLQSVTTKDVSDSTFYTASTE